MGITIHYRGRLKDIASREICFALLRDFAEENAWDCHEYEEENVTITHSYEDALEEWHEWDYQGPATAAVLLPHEACEPLSFIVDNDLYFSGYTKTQYAPAEIHMAIIHLFRLIQPYMKELVISDEGEYWETRNAARLIKNQAENMDLIQKVMCENSPCEGPVRFAEGRIIDFVQRTGDQPKLGEIKR